jgi:hypothetical protein
MQNFLDRLRGAAIDWQATEASPYELRTTFEGREVRLSLNDFPEERVCTVIVDGVEMDLDEFPDAWRLPRHRGES